jgi:hypothetical protein
MSEILEHAWAAEPHEVQAILAGRQLQFRRPVEGVRLFGEDYDRRWYPHAIPPYQDDLEWRWYEGPPHGPSCYHFAVCPWGKPGDRVWVGEAFTRGVIPTHADGAPNIKRGPAGIPQGQYEGYQQAAWYGGDPDPWGWFTEREPTAAADMPRWASRLLLEIESVRVERLHDMKDKAALAEGVEVVGGGRYALGAPGLKPQGSVLDAYRTLHAHQYGPERWALNEWYWVVKFRVVERPVTI